MTCELSVIIPALNEADCLPRLLADLKAQRGIALEIVVSDGGSTDDTLARCRPFAPVIVRAPRGRARQLNAGFRHSTGPNLLFLHADSRLREPDLLRRALAHWQRALAGSRREAVAGHFPLEFIRSDRTHNMTFRYMEGKTRFNRVNTTNGDQGFLLARSFFENLGGFDESQHFLEDQKLAEKIRDRGAWITLPGKLYTSGRRFEVAGCHRLYILMSILMALYSTGRMEFFKRAGNIYAGQSETGRLLLKPYFGAVIKMFVYDLGCSGTLRAWLHIGRYIRQNSWQMFYFFDVLLETDRGKRPYPCLAFHDNYFSPLTDHAVCDALVAVVSFFWFMLILAPFFYLVDSVRPNER